jgi:hypothetical protein
MLAGGGSWQETEFRRTCEERVVPPGIVPILKQFQANRGGDNRSHFELLRAFCLRRQLAAPREKHPEWADLILDTNDVVVLLGVPDDHTKEGAWLYYFNPEHTWHLELEFQDGRLFHTSYRQLLAAEEIAEQIQEQERKTTNTAAPGTALPRRP